MLSFFRSNFQSFKVRDSEIAHGSCKSIPRELSKDGRVTGFIHLGSFCLNGCLGSKDLPGTPYKVDRARVMMTEPYLIHLHV